MKKLIIILTVIIVVLGLIYFIPKIFNSIKITPAEAKVMSIDGITFEFNNSDIQLVENEPTTMNMIRDDDTLGYKIQKLNITPTGIELYMRPLNMLWYNSNILFANAKQNCLTVMNLKGEIIENIGKTGNGPGEFNIPRNICADDKNNYYIIESGNRRIQIFNDKFEYVSEININEISEKTEKIKGDPYSLAVTNEGDIYVSFHPLMNDTGGILYISSDRKNIKIIENMCGILSVYQNDVYLLEFGEIVEDNSQGIKQYVLQTGKNRFIKFKDGKISETYNFTEGYSASSLYLYSNKIFSYSLGIKRFNEFDMKSQYISTLLDTKNFIKENHLLYGFIKDNEGAFYAIELETGDLYKIYKE